MMKRLMTAAASIALSAMMAHTAGAATATKSVFGTLADGTPIEGVTLKNSHGLSAHLITYGAMWQAMHVPDRNGKMADIILGYDTIGEYVARNQYSGMIVGRYANRIAKGQFTLDGKSYQLAINNPPNALHGGPTGFEVRVWKITHIDAGGAGKPASVTMEYVSKDGEEGYPGTMTVDVTYTLTDSNDLSIGYKATTDAPTIINLTNHALFNLEGVTSGHSALNATAQVEADTYLPTDKTAIPTGDCVPVKGTAFDFTKPADINARAHDGKDPQILIGTGIDHNFCLRGGVTKTPKLAVTMIDHVSGRGMKIFTTEPGIQFYTGNFLDGITPGKGGVTTRQGDGVAYEAQHYPDSPNHPDYPSTRLDPGQTYTQTTSYHFYTVK
ncbi:aldose epimerase family protein [Asticcacaulis sp. EMRT-3]|uniref:aldose epimerase family protein n=1 Tax=Asticcacaulis sp. EMRT-3 TaxID=3040349 RepID=UPI0024AF11F9|nr:aldose epimerase family protein [Asticcacaulis sp. EMRT-3]MDI7775246.1 aldose epimerase family protein [Asticcacaulis sp. EMRT-3]